MNVYTPRTTAPSANDPHWISNLYGGLNECIVIDKNTGSVIPNCTGYAWGRWYELLNSRPKLARTDAKTWFNTRDGYSRGQVPAVGAVACWAGGKYGHVAIVESIGDGYIMVSQSNYGGARFEYAKAYKLPNGKYQSPRGDTVFQGFIYIPIKYDAYGSGQPEPGKYKSVDDIARAIIRGTGEWYKCYGETRRKKVESYGFDYNTVQKRINEILGGK